MNVIDTERLILRTWQKKDAFDYFQINQDEKVIEFLRGPLTQSQVKDFMEHSNKQLEERGYTLWAVELKATGELIGFVGLNYTDWPAHFTPAVEIGWRLGSQYWGKGYAREAAAAVLNFGFEQCDLKEIVSFTVPANVRSIRVMENIGMKRDLSGDFAHPKLPTDHPLSLHVLYRISKPAHKQLVIDDSLVRRLIATQFPQWKNLPITAVSESGWDNRTFHLGSEMSIRLPSGEEYERQVQKEQEWLPKIAPHLPLPIPQPIAMGMPSEGYPWHWSIYKWLEGESANKLELSDAHLEIIAVQLAQFLNEFHQFDAAGAPAPGLHNWWRAAHTSVYDSDTEELIEKLKDFVDVDKARSLWQRAINSKWDREPVWVHGDVASGNLLVKDNRLVAVIDFGCMGIGDPACDLTIAWTFFRGESRRIFKAHLHLDEETWARARGWAMWKALFEISQLEDKCGVNLAKQLQIIDAVLEEHRSTNE